MLANVKLKVQQLLAVKTGFGTSHKTGIGA